MALFYSLFEPTIFNLQKVFCEFQKADEKGGMMKWMNNMDELEILYSIIHPSSDGKC